MATLHVRNVPDALYDVLREEAEANGRSIGAEAIHVLTRGLFGRRRRLPRGVRPQAGQSAFDADARAAVAAAQDVARELGCDHIRTEHLLLALAAVPGSFAATLLEDHGSSRDRLLERVERGSGSPQGSLPFGPDTKQALELALRESLRWHSREIRPVHLVLGLLGAEGAAAELLGGIGVDANAVRRAPYKIAPVIVRPSPESEFRVVELDGSAEEWERQLNELADEYELVQVVDRRAIFRRPE